MTRRFSPLALVAVLGALAMMSPPRLPWPVAVSGAAKTSAPVVAPAAAPAVARTVLALWDSRYADSPRRTPVHTLAEMPLNYLGLVVRYHDIRHGLPPREALSGVRGVLTWFTSEALPDPQAYLTWLDGVSRAGLPVMVIGNLGALKNDAGDVTSIDAVNRVVSRLGWQYETRWMTTTVGVRYQAPDIHLVTFERPLPKVVPPYPLTHASGTDARVLLHVEHPTHADMAADVIVVSPRGAFVAPDFAFFADRSGEREFRQWYINPFELFRQVFTTDDVPKADTATLSGRRIYYSHIDGDGWRSLTQIEPYRSRYVIAARVVLDEVIRTNTDLPVSVGAVAGDLDPAWTGTAESLAVARDIYAQPQVEAAIHTYSHPLQWPYFEPDRRETRRVKGEEDPDLMGPDVVHVAEGQEPRSYTMKPFSLSLEIAGAAEFVNRLLPPGKRVTLMQWPGDTRPFRQALAETRTAGLANINGGDTRFDREFPSAAWVAPLANQVGGELQVYASNSNENTYTDLWRGRYFGFGFLTKTIENTGAPRRLKPFNLYYHMYSGERLSSLNAVRANLTYARTVPIAPIETSRYSRIVEGFYHTAFEPVGRRAWRVRHRGALQTLRFDTAVESVDFERSRGVIGQRHELGSLYVALDEAVELPVVALKQMAAAKREPSERVPYLVESRWRVHSVRTDGAELRFVTEGYGFGEGRWNWPHGARAEVVWRAAGGRSGRVIAEHDADGLLDVHLPPLTGERVEVSITPRAGDGIR